MKYIIDMPENPAFVNAFYYTDGTPIATNITRFEPYTEPDLNITKDNSVHLCNSCNRMDSLVPCPTTDGDVLFGEDGKSVCCCKLYKPHTRDRKAIEDEVWELAKACCDIMDYEWQLDTYRQAKGKIEAWKNQKDEIRVGDEVYSKVNKWRGVVTDIDDGDLTILGASGQTACHYNPKHFGKTGKHFDDIKILLDGLKEGYHGR